MSDPKKTEEDELAGTEQPFVQHLIELRNRLLYACYGIGIVLVGLFIYPGPSHLYDLLALPLVKALPQGSTMIAIGVISPFLVPIKVTVLTAVAVALPWILYQVWAFVAPGLYRHERRLVLPLIVASTALFYVGAAFCYFFVFGQAFPEIQRLAPHSVAITPDIESYLDFAMTMFLAFGIAFQVPVVIIILARMGVVSVKQLRSWRPYYLVAAAGVAGLVTPPDPLSMLSLLVPMYMLYEVGIWAAQFFIRFSKKPEEGAETSKEVSEV